MEKYIMFLDWKNQYNENECTTQSNLQIQCIPVKLRKSFFTELNFEAINFTSLAYDDKLIHMLGNYIIKIKIHSVHKTVVRIP